MASAYDTTNRSLITAKGLICKFPEPPASLTIGSGTRLVGAFFNKRSNDTYYD